MSHCANAEVVEIQELAQRMLDELDSGYLEVCKVPSPRGGYIRVPVSVNAAWYRIFCRKHLRSRRRYPKPRTIIRRCHTRRALKRLASGSPQADGVYIERLRHFMEDDHWR